MAIDVSEILMDDTDEAPSGAVSGDSATAKRGRGRPKGAATRKGTAAPRLAGTRELAQLLAKVIGGASILVALAVQADEAAMTPQEANDIAKPAARLLAKSGWAVRMTQLAGKGGDYVDLALALATYGLRVYPLIVQRQQMIELERQAQRGRPFGQPSTEDARVRPSGPQAPAASNGHAGNAADADAAARAAADAARWGGLGFANPDALATGLRGDIAAIVRAAPPN